VGSPAVIVKWQRGVPVYAAPIISMPFIATVVVAAIGLSLIVYRQFTGPGVTAGMTGADAYHAWKTFNTMALTALGSGSFAIGLAAWIFRQSALHAVMRVALLVSLLVYATCLLAIVVDIGRPWAVWNVLLPGHWNPGSRLWDVSLSLPVFALFLLLLENTPPVLERLYYRHLILQRTIRGIRPAIRATYPWVMALACVLPILHQSSLGALMLAAGDRVHPLWQTPLLPVLYVLAAAFIGTATISVTLLLASLRWKRSLDSSVLRDLATLTSRLALWWLGARLLDLAVRGVLTTAVAVDWFALVFWMETIAIGGAALALRRSTVNGNASRLVLASLAMAAGGMIYRFAPPALAFTPEPMAWSTGSVTEILIGLGLIALCHLGFLAAVKHLPILPAPVTDWHDVVNYYRHLYPRIAKWNADQAKAAATAGAALQTRESDPPIPWKSAMPARRRSSSSSKLLLIAAPSSVSSWSSGWRRVSGRTSMRCSSMARSRRPT
jgi:Ni/Fe-hydrogenase subunit HybB-like protein